MHCNFFRFFRTCKNINKNVQLLRSFSGMENGKVLWMLQVLHGDINANKECLILKCSLGNQKWL